MKKNFKINILKFLNGFTLIELLIVISIIGIISTISIFALQNSRSIARDAQRMSELQLIANGLELFKADCSYYPINLPTPGQALDDTRGIYTVGTSVTPCATPPPGGEPRRYIESVPSDPDPSRRYVYSALGCVTPASGGWGFCPRFRLWAALENPQTTPNCPGVTPPSCATGIECNYCITSP